MRDTRKKGRVVNGATLDELKVMFDAEIAFFRKKMRSLENQVKGI